MLPYAYVSFTPPKSPEPSDYSHHNHTPHASAAAPYASLPASVGEANIGSGGGGGGGEYGGGEISGRSRATRGGGVGAALERAAWSLAAVNAAMNASVCPNASGLSTY